MELVLNRNGDASSLEQAREMGVTVMFGKELRRLVRTQAYVFNLCDEVIQHWDRLCRFQDRVWKESENTEEVRREEERRCQTEGICLWKAARTSVSGSVRPPRCP